jgi:hypothetical protein
MNTLSVHLEQQAHIEDAIDKIKRLEKINSDIIFCRGMASVHVEIINTPVFEIIDITRPGAKSLLNMVYARCLSYTPATLAMQATKKNEECRRAQNKRDQQHKDNFDKAVKLAIQQSTTP